MFKDKLQRPLKDLRISVTDRCNYRCTYCMPHDEYEWIDRKELLSFEEITRLASIFVSLGVEKIRLTGGEPLLRRDLERLIRPLAQLGTKDLCLTTNGSLLTEKAAALAEAGLRRINVSLDTLDPEKFFRITRRQDLPKILAGIAEAERVGLGPIKINTVIERGINDGEIIPLVEYARSHGYPIRFIEYMDVGNANDWKSQKTVGKSEILAIVHARYPIREVGRGDASQPSLDYQFVDGGGELGIIASVTEPFCGGCTRARFTADGRLVTCLFAERGRDRKAMLRGGSSDEQMAEEIVSIWNGRADRFSEERLEAMKSPGGYKPEVRKKIEMISLGG